MIGKDETRGISIREYHHDSAMIIASIVNLQVGFLPTDNAYNVTNNSMLISIIGPSQGSFHHYHLHVDLFDYWPKILFASSKPFITCM